MYGNKIVFEYLIYLFIPLIFNIICRVNKKQKIIKICSSQPARAVTYVEISKCALITSNMRRCNIFSESPKIRYEYFLLFLLFLS